MLSRNASVRVLLALLVFSTTTMGSPPGPPQWFGDIGVKRLADFYPTDIAIGPNGTVHYTDNSRSSVFRYSASGELELQITGIPGFVRGLVVDSQGRIYVSANNDPDTWVYSPEGDLIDTWVGIGSSGFGTVDDQDRLYLGVGKQVAVFDTAGNELWRFGTAGSGPGDLENVSDVALAPDGSIWVVDERLYRLNKYDADGNHLLTVGRFGTAPDEFKMPVSVGVDSIGNVYVSDRRNSRIQKFDSDGGFLASWGSNGTGPGQLHESHGLDIGADDTIWVAGYHAYSIQQFNQDGSLLTFWQGHMSGPGEFSEIHGIEVVDGVLFATDYWNNRVEAFNAYTGKFLYEFGKRGQGDSTVFNFPRGLDADSEGDLYIPDDGHTRRIKRDGTFVDLYSFRQATGGKIIGSQDLVVDEQGIMFQANSGRDTAFKIDTNIDNGELLLEWGSSGSGAGQFREPMGVTFGVDDNLYIAEKDNDRVQTFDKDGNFVAFWGPFLNGAASIAYDSQRGIYYVGGWSEIVALDLVGAELFRWGGNGSGIGEFSGGVADIEIDDNGVLYLADRKNGRVQRYIYPSPVTSTTGKPDYEPGVTTGIYVWKDTYDGHYKLRSSSDGTSRRFLVKLVSTLPFEHVSTINLATNDSLTVKENLILLDSEVSAGENGIDFMLPPGARVMISVEQDGVIKYGLVQIGGTNNHPAVAGWILSSTDLPPTPAFQGGVDAGLFLGTGADDDHVEARINGNGPRVLRELSLISVGAPLSTTVPVGIEFCCDQLHIGSYEVNLVSFISTWWDGVDVTVPPESEGIAIAFSDGGLFPAHMVNPNIDHDLGIPGAYWVPPAAPYGQPEYDPGNEEGLFLWKDKATGMWYLRGTAGGENSRYKGEIASDQPFTIASPDGLEANDVFDTADPARIVFDLKMGGIWQDGINFQLPPGAEAHLTLETVWGKDPVQAIRLGAQRWPVEQVPVNIGGW